MPEETDNLNQQEADSAKNSQAKKAMRDIILKWIGEGEAPKEPAPAAKASAEAVSGSVVRVSRPAVDDRQRRAVHEALSRVKSSEKSSADKPSRPGLKNSRRPMQEPQVMLEKYEAPLLAKGRRHINIFAWLYGAAWSAFILGTVVLAVGVYKLGWNDPLTNRLLNYVPLPYGFVRYHPIWYGTYRAEYQAISRFRSQQPASALSPISPEEIEDILIRRTIANDLAWGRGLWVSNSEAAGELRDIAARAGSEEEVERTIETFWGFNIDEYKRLVIRPYLLKKKLYAVLSDDYVIKQRFGNANDLQALESYLDQLKDSTPVILFR